MSVVTSIIVTFPYSENEAERIMEINSFEQAGRKFSFHWIDDPKSVTCYSGNKKFNSIVLLGSYSNFPIESFLSYISTMVHWEDPTFVQILINSEGSNDRTFAVYANAGLLQVVPSAKW